jgi:hypothetical protein
MCLFRCRALEEKDVELIAEYLKTKIFNCGPHEPQSCKISAAACWQP